MPEYVSYAPDLEYGITKRRHLWLSGLQYEYVKRKAKAMLTTFPRQNVHHISIVACRQRRVKLNPD